MTEDDSVDVVGDDVVVPVVAAPATEDLANRRCGIRADEM